MKQLTAEQAIAKIESVKTKFFNHEVEKYNVLAMRKKLENMAKVGMISPKEFWRASKITWKTMQLSHGYQNAEYERLNKK